MVQIYKGSFLLPLGLMCLGGHTPLWVPLACGDWRRDFYGGSEFGHHELGNISTLVTYIILLMVDTRVQRYRGSGR